MPPTRETQTLLDAMAANPGPAMSDVGPEEARANYVALRALLGPGEPVANVENRTIPGPAGEIPIRVYHPEGAGPFPAYVYYHGGGWVIGNLETSDTSCRLITNRSGCAVVSVDYRLAPEHRYPAAADDCYAALEWVAAHGAEIGVDPTQIAVGGDSAGGNLAAVVAQMARDKDGPVIGLQVLNYPVTNCDFTTASYRDNAEGFGLGRQRMEWFWEQYLASPEQGTEPYASPARATELSGLPPTLVLTAELDPLRDEGEAYAHSLQAAAVPVTCTRYEGLIHGFLGQTHAVPEAIQAHTQIANALKAALG